MCRHLFHASFCVCPETSFCVPCLWRPARNVWPCRACVRPDPLAMSLPAAPPVVRQKPGRRYWSDAQWPCHAVLPICVVASCWSQAGDRFRANHRPPNLAAGIRLHCIAADPSPGSPQDRSAHCKYHLSGFLRAVNYIYFLLTDDRPQNTRFLLGSKVGLSGAVFHLCFYEVSCYGL